MPGVDKRGPNGMGIKTGREGGRNSFDGGHGRNNGGGFGPGGECVCAGCGYKTYHERGVKCTNLKCPECGRTLVREELLKNKSK